VLREVIEFLRAPAFGRRVVVSGMPGGVLRIRIAKSPSSVGIATTATSEPIAGTFTPPGGIADEQDSPAASGTHIRRCS
jgi:hypothetical protein